MYENFVGTWETVRNREVSVLERCPHGEVRERLVPLRLKDRSSDETCILDNIFGFLQFRAMSYFRITTQIKRFLTGFAFLL